MLLTGYADVNAARDAVNEGNIFRFLTKPCEKDSLTSALNAGLARYHLVVAEKGFSKNTLMGSIKVLTDVLAAASPEAFGRSLRITQYVRHLAARFNLPSPWRFEAAAMLSQLGCVTLDPTLLQDAYAGTLLSAADHARFAAHPQVAKSLLSHAIPRMEPIAWMIGQQHVPRRGSRDRLRSARAGRSGPLCSERRSSNSQSRSTASACTGLSREDAIAGLWRQQSEFGPKLIEALDGIKSEGTRMELRTLPTARLTTGMVLQQEIRSRAGMLIVTKGQEITPALLIKLENFSRAKSIDDEITALVPIEF